MKTILTLIASETLLNASTIQLDKSAVLPTHLQKVKLYTELDLRNIREEK